jgi:hypothetical protein
MIQEPEFKFATLCHLFNRPSSEDGMDFFCDKMKFHQFFIETCELANKLNNPKSVQNLISLLEVIPYAPHYSLENNNERALLKSRIAYLSDYLSLIKNFLFQNIDNNKGLDYQKHITKNFQTLLPQYSFIKSEQNIELGRIDILAKCKESNRDVIIEIKNNYKNNHSTQLFRYAKSYKNPILVAIAPKFTIKKNSKIIYIEIPYTPINNLLN